MRRNRPIIVARCLLFRAGLILAFALSALRVGGPALAQTGATQRSAPVPRLFAPLPPGDSHQDDSTDVYVLTLPSNIPLPRPSVSSVPRRPSALAGQQLGAETEPNGTPAQATQITSGQTVHANLYPNGDVDYYAFSAQAGDRVYAATMTSFSAGSSTDSQMTLYAPDGVSIIEFDDDNGSFAGLSSSIAGAVITATGTYYIKVNDFTAGTTSERGYDLHFRLQSGTPTPETESNDTPATANPLPANGWVAGTRNPAAATEQDWFSMTLAAGDTVFLSLDVDPERDNVRWNGRLGMALFGDAGNQILVVDDAGTGDVAPTPTIPSEALFITVKDAGVYYAFVDSASAAVGGPTATYNLSVDILPAANEGVNCTTYTSTDVPKTIGPGTGLVSSTITIPGHPRIADLDVEITMNHALMGDVDAQLRSPQNNDIGLFTDIGAAATGGQRQMDVIFDDEAGIPPSFTALKGLALKPELAYRLGWFDGEDAGGTWTLDLRDDTAGANGGTLTDWSLRVCEVPPPPVCPSRFVSTTVFSTDFEADESGFTHSGAQDEWGYGLPATSATSTANPIAAFDACNSGTYCWKTDLTSTYNINSNQDLLSPHINLITVTAPIVVTWAQRYQMESANFDHAYVDFQQAGGATPVRLWEWLDATMTNASGNPAVNIPASAGWGVHTARADSLAGLDTELRFHLDSDNAVVMGGLAIDDVSVQGCTKIPPVADAGDDQVVSAGISVTLDGSASTDLGPNLPLTYTWSQDGSPAVTLSDAAAVSPTFTAPATSTVLTFTLSVTDSFGLMSAPDTVLVTVSVPPPDPPGYASLPASSSAITVGAVVAGKGKSVTTTLTISNVGNAGSSALNITSHSLSGPDAADFSVSPATLSIASGEAPQQLSIRCTPSKPGLRTALLTVNHNAAGSPATYSLACVGKVVLLLINVRRNSP